jgi:DNA-binding NtrC family response regulator
MNNAHRAIAATGAPGGRGHDEGAQSLPRLGVRQALTGDARDPGTFAASDALPESRGGLRGIRGHALRNRMAHLLLIDDDLAFLPEQVRQAFPAPTHRVTSVATGALGIEQVRATSPDVILLDLHLPDQSGLAVYGQIRAIDARTPVIFITAAKTVDTAIEAMKLGAFNYLHKPLDLRQLQNVIGEALEVAVRMRSPVVLSESADEGGEGAFIGSSKAMLEAYKAIGRVTAQDVPVLITGESGTGKELAARAVYKHGARAKAPFLALNCAAIPENLLESELFGHERGAFTGADRRRIGKFEQNSGGTILLDEIGDMALPLQAKILRLLQEQTFQRVGGNETIQTDVRIIAATHRDLRALAAEGRFREDLYYRLAVSTIYLPPLRERGDDIPILARHFLARYNREFGKEVRDVAPEAMKRLREHTWPGNIRELQSVLKQALLCATGSVLVSSFLPDLSPSLRPSSLPSANFDLDGLIGRSLTPRASEIYAEVHREVDRFLLTRVLEYTNGNHRHAARLLGVARQTISVKLRALGLHVTHVVAGDDDDDGRFD